MLQLQNIIKDYGSGDNIVHALKGINLSFRNNEFVSILGPSGCGKTTMLNIIGGLDRYSAGDLLINGKSTKDYTDYDWDTYRNKTIGFVFQTYNLIPHLTIQENVEMALSLAGISKAERRKRASEALTSVGLADKLKKKPSELSGGQMQRVAIARALVNNPSVVLADEPTGALDTDTGLQVMEVLKKVAQDRLVIMVTHNPQLAETYSTRIIKILDGKITDDSHPLSEEEVKMLEEKDQANLQAIAALPKEEKKKLDRQSRMSLATAFSLSYHNLLTKKKRSFITAFACSIGVIGMTVILSVSSGMQSYVDTTMAESAYANYVTISTNYVDLSQVMSAVGNTSSSSPEYPENTTGVTPYTPTSISVVKQNLNQDYLNYVDSVTADKVVAVDYTYGVNVNALLKNSSGVYQFSSTSVWSQILNNEEYIGTQYETLYGSGIPTSANEATLVVDKYNRLSTTTLAALGITYSSDMSEIPYEDIVGKEFKVIVNDDFYSKNAKGLYDPLKNSSSQSSLQSAYESSKSIDVKIVSVVRRLKDASNDWIGEGLGYTAALSKQLMAADRDSEVAKAQVASTKTSVIDGSTFLDTPRAGFFTLYGSTYESALAALGYLQTPTTISIYPLSFNAKSEIKADLDQWNEDHPEQIVKYNDISSYITQSLDSIINIITYVLVAFSAVSLVISSIMIALIIYASVIERTKEIGVYRALGARKKDIARIFESEASILGALSGALALAFALIDDLIINAVIRGLASVTTSIAVITPVIGLSMMALAIALPLIASLIPASIAAKKDPVVALRTE
jgi:putative ABC transport system permease protein